MEHVRYSICNEIRSKICSVSSIVYPQEFILLFDEVAKLIVILNYCFFSANHDSRIGVKRILWNELSPEFYYNYISPSRN